MVDFMQTGVSLANSVAVIDVVEHFKGKSFIGENKHRRESGNCI